jgi:hypothetical protein
MTQHPFKMQKIPQTMLPPSWIININNFMVKTGALFRQQTNNSEKSSCIISCMFYQNFSNCTIPKGMNLKEL